MSNSTQSTNNITSENGPVIIPDTPLGMKKYIVISDKHPDPNGELLCSEIKYNTSVEELLEDINRLHKEIEDVFKFGDKIVTDCNGCFKNCFASYDKYW